MTRKIENLLRKLHISKRIFAVLTVSVILFTVVLLVVTNSIVRTIMKKEYFQNDMQLQAETAQSIDVLMEDINLFSVRLMGNEKLYRIFRYNTKTYEQKLSSYRECIKELSDGMKIANVLVVDNDGNAFSYDETESFSFDYGLLSNVDKKTDHLGVYGHATSYDGESYIVLGRRYYFYSTSASIGYLFLYFPESEISDILVATASNGTSMLVTGDGLVVSSTDSSKRGTTLLDSSILTDEGYKNYDMIYAGSDCIYTVSQIKQLEHSLSTKFYTLSIYPKSNLYSSMNKLSLMIVVLEFAVTVFAVVFGLKKSKDIVKPIHKLQNNISDFGRNGKLTPSYITGDEADDEFRELENAYNDMLNRITELTNKNIDEKLEQRKLQLDALQAQINPHFLYNTLDTIVWIAKIKKQKEIEDLAMALAGFFRISLHRGDKFISLREELDFVKGFVLIQQTRFPNKFEFMTDIPDDLLDCKIFKISIQPFVENSIKHGIAPKIGTGCITVSARRNENDLEVTIADDGVGTDEKTAAENQGELVGLQGYGIKNVDERIKLEYGNNYGVRIESEAGIGTTVKVKIPFIRD